MENREYNEWYSGVRHLIYSVRVVKQTILSRRTGIPKEYLNAILRGRSSAGEASQERIANALGFTVPGIRAIGQRCLADLPPNAIEIERIRQTYVDGENAEKIENTPPIAQNADSESIRRAIVRYVNERFVGKNIGWQLDFARRFSEAFPDFAQSDQDEGGEK